MLLGSNLLFNRPLRRGLSLSKKSSFGYLCYRTEISPPIPTEATLPGANAVEGIYFQGRNRFLSLASPDILLDIAVTGGIVGVTVFYIYPVVYDGVFHLIGYARECTHTSLTLTTTSG